MSTRIVIFTKKLSTGSEVIIGATVVEFNTALPEQIAKLAEKGISCATVIVSGNATTRSKFDEVINRLLKDGKYGLILEPR